MIDSILIIAFLVVTSSEIANNLETTRTTFPSTVATGSLNAMEAMADAVYFPIPFNLMSSAYELGN